MKIDYVRLFLLNYIYLFILEISFKLFVVKTFDYNIIYLFIFSLPLAMIITFLMSISRKKWVNQVLSWIIWLVIFFIFAAETVYYSFYKTICGFSALMYGGQVMEFASAILVHIRNNWAIILWMLVLCSILLFLSAKKVIKHDRFDIKDTAVILLATFIFMISSLEYNAEATSSAKDLYYNTDDLLQSTNKFGLLNALGINSLKLAIGFEERIDIENTFDFTYDEEQEYNVTDIDFDSLILNEDDSTIKSMHEYFSQVTPTEQNEYTGVFAGKNLIFIVAEGFSPIAVDEELTPTLYKLVNNGFVFENYYQPIYNCSTSDGEFISMLSILPGVATCSMKETEDVYLPYSLGNLMKNYGYSTYAFHGWTYSYYGRDKTMPNLGYTYYGYDRYNRGYKYALSGIKDSWPTSDIDVVNASYDIYSNDERFVAYYMTISGHLEYNFTGGNAISIKNKSIVDDLDASDAIKAYIASQIEFDRSLELLLDKLENDGILDDTVIVITADHYPYGLSNEEIADYVDWMQNENFDLYKNNLVIYNSDLETKVVDKYTSSLDLLPTLLNLFGVKYDSRLLIGTDIFSNSDDLVIFNNKSWITDKGRYDYLKGEFEPFTDEELDSDYVDKINDIVSLKFQMSKLLISKDYYRTLKGG